VRETHLYDFHYGNREAVDFPHKLWQRLASARMAHAVPTRSPTQGYPPLREALAAYLARTRAVRCVPEQIVIVNGSQQALDLLSRLLIDPGDEAVLEEPHYHGARQAFRAAGARLVPCPVDDDGLCVDALPRGLNRPARLVYVTPSHQFPTGAILPLSRRLVLIEWAERRNSYIIEDDYDGELRYDCRPIEAVQAHDRAGHVVYVGTFSKTLSPELRLGYVIVPQPLLPAFLAAKWVSDLLASTLLQAVLADLLREGYYERHLRRLRKRNASRRMALLQAAKVHLDGLATVSGAKAGMHAVLWLPTVPVCELSALVERAKKLGVLVYPMSNYYSGQTVRSGILLSFSSLHEEEIHRGIELLGQAIRSQQ
jgi:GntR family transcriptional regulator/MocR family aminotransferase